MRLAVFDIDGTLTRTVGYCDEHFAAAIAAIAGVEQVPADWGLFPDATDSGLADAHFREATGRRPDESELRRIHDHFLDALRRADVRAAPVDGAHDVLARVAGRGWRVAIATGNWRAAAEVKFRWAGMPFPDVPIATADDASARADILRAAIRRAGGEFERVVYFGDGRHDARAARACGTAFVGVTAGRDPGPLRDEGVRTFLDHFADDGRVRRALDRAAVPVLSADGR